jgi:hypothetical protein
VRWVWRDGRLSWDVVGAVVFVTAAVLATDLAWRFTRIQFETLAIYAVSCAAAVLLAVLALRWCVCSRRRRGPPASNPVRAATIARQTMIVSDRGAR